MDTRHLKCFTTVARTLNFNDAAKILNYSQSTVSDQIRSLEQQLGVKLFERLGKKVFLNEQGTRLIPLAERMVRESDEIEQLFSDNNEVTGSLTIGAAESLCVFWLPPVLKKYQTVYPKVQIIIKVGNCLEFNQRLQQNDIDVAFSLNDESEQAQLRQIELFHEETLFIASPDSALANLSNVRPRDLANQILILPEADCGYRRELESRLAKRNVPMNSLMEFGSLEAIKQCVKNNLGISLLPKIVVDEEINRGELIQLNWTDTPIAVQARMIFHHEKWMSPALLALEKIVLSSLPNKN